MISFVDNLLTDTQVTLLLFPELYSLEFSNHWWLLAAAKVERGLSDFLTITVPAFSPPTVFHNSN